jgi:hypothetical protein
MTPERYQKINELFHTALEQAPEQRADVLDEACAGDEELRREVESLISSHEQTGSFIDSPAFEAATSSFIENPRIGVVGQRIGRYKVLSLLGRVAWEKFT